MDDNHTLSHTTWNCKYHVVFAPKYRRKEFYGINRHFWCRGYYVDTVGKDEKKIRAYIDKQLTEDHMAEQLTLEKLDPFTGSKY